MLSKQTSVSNKVIAKQPFNACHLSISQLKSFQKRTFANLRDEGWSNDERELNKIHQLALLIVQNKPGYLWQAHRNIKLNTYLWKIRTNDRRNAQNEITLSLGIRF